LGILFRALFWGIGFSLAVWGGISVIVYLNLLTTGNNLVEYASFLTTRVECYLLPIGVSIVNASIFAPYNKKKN
jgi:hypothetical protein